MALSVCCFTNVPGAVLAASIQPLRSVADEILIAYDARVDPGLIGPVLDIADQIYRVEVAPPYLERVLGWLLAQCRGTWIFRIDGDEIPSAALVDALAALDDDGDGGQYLIPRRWLFPDPRHWIDQDPWYPDYQARITRNLPEFTEVEGRTHSNVRLVDDAETLATPIYHTVCLTTPYPERASRAAMYEELRPGHRTDTGTPMMSFYLPEDAFDLALAPVAPDDAGLVGSVMGTAPLAAAAPKLPVVPLAEIDEWWPGRQLADDDYRGQLAVVRTPSGVTPGGEAEVVVEVTNRSSRTWHRASKLALGGRWRRGASLRPPESRAVLPASVPAGGTVVVVIPVRIADDHKPSDVLELDMVDEGIRWFGQGVDLTLS